jgi:hypothetical protein
VSTVKTKNKLRYIRLFKDESRYPPLLKGHGNEADFLGFLHKTVRHRSITLRFEPFRFWLRIRKLPDSPNRGVADSPSFLLNIQKPTLRLPDSVGESFFEYEYLREVEAKSGTARKVV